MLTHTLSTVKYFARKLRSQPLNVPEGAEKIKFT